MPHEYLKLPPNHRAMAATATPNSCSCMYRLPYLFDDCGGGGGRGDDRVGWSELVWWCRWWMLVVWALNAVGNGVGNGVGGHIRRYSQMIDQSIYSRSSARTD